MGCCIECGTEFQIDLIDNFPVNIALLNVTKKQYVDPMKKVEALLSSPEKVKHEPKRNRIQSNFSSINISLCDNHNKKIQAFCDLDKKILCIDCIVNGNHKNHEILSIEMAR